MFLLDPPLIGPGYNYIVNSVHEYFAVTDSHLQISQHQASLKHENSQYHITATPRYYHKTFCSYSYILFVHFIAATICGLQKLGLDEMVGYHYVFLI